MEKIGKIILKDELISMIKFVDYLNKKELSFLFGYELYNFHKACYEDALKRKSFKDLVHVHSFCYMDLKRKVAISIHELLLKGSRKNKKELLNDWYFYTIPDTRRIDYIKSLKLNRNVSEEEYINLLIQYAKLDLQKTVKIYIQHILLEKGELQKNLELQKIAFEDNIRNSKSGGKFFRLLFENAKENDDLDTIKWMYSIHNMYHDKFQDKLCIGRKDVAEYLCVAEY